MSTQVKGSLQDSGHTHKANHMLVKDQGCSQGGTGYLAYPTLCRPDDSVLLKLDYHLLVTI